MTVSYDDAAARAVELAKGPVEPYPHAELEGDAVAGGWAFAGASLLVIVAHDGGHATTSLSHFSPEDTVTSWLAKQRHRHRRVDEDALGDAQRLALEAVRRDVPVTSLAAGVAPDVVDHAERLAIMLRRWRPRDGGDPVRVFASHDHLLEPARDGERHTHPCPLCGTPAVHADRYPRSVCDACAHQASDSTGRRVSGFNTSVSGGFVAHYADSPDGEVCVEVTRSGRCFVDGVECTIGEARFGGTVVQAL
jgi:hypothetical protein